MPPIESILSVTLAGLALSMTPGPSMLYVFSRSVGQSRAAGLASAVGLCIGGILLAVATALGLATVFITFDWLVVVMRYIGSAYLVWLGIGMIRDARMMLPVDVPDGRRRHRPVSRIIWQGILVEVLNPKTVLFFALFLPPFVSLAPGQASGLDVTLQLLILGCLVPLTAVPADLLVATMGGTLTRSLRKNHRIGLYLGWCGGLILIGIAFYLLADVLGLSLFF